MPPMAFVGRVFRVGFMDKTATIKIPRYVMHKKTGKQILRHTKLLAHDENNELKMNDEVVVRNCAPISARKRFTLERILKSPESDSLNPAK